MAHVLLLGGTGEARALAGRLAGRPGLRVTLSLAGRTLAPAPQPVPVRVGGFGGATGLADYLKAEGIAAVIDATHPYAARISANAAEACAAAGVPLLALRRPPWERREGDRWREAVDVPAAIAALGAAPRRVFLALGRNEVRAAEAAPQHSYVVRSVDPIAPPLAVPDARYVLGRGPFTQEGDRALLAAHGIDAIVAKNSGGAATYGKIAAARALGIGVILIARPLMPDGPAVDDIGAAEAWLMATLAHRAGPAERGA
ncbi:cobalt-precorrin-6A reductase [Xanthobacter tagetidis]|uniref:Cobalt-precorrin-6A reductase n=1 Tax=Xanthobacter tagetidis TaxID=60216 RepID=A0A3L7APE9_9HYPH|nr:cobalt-precorrin-6A reductase [Xanthobacter tagetidis]MBB6307850.1 precorrin-6A/cobalt-precorrin-6A reductase [Xanthobacter tagetidis]RLP81511.1 cobalt-precorrin-6A reductase [Xanthobacter tagetidis]